MFFCYTKKYIVNEHKSDQTWFPFYRIQNQIHHWVEIKTPFKFSQCSAYISLLFLLFSSIPDLLVWWFCCWDWEEISFSGYLLTSDIGAPELGSGFSNFHTLSETVFEQPLFWNFCNFFTPIWFYFSDANCQNFCKNYRIFCNEMGCDKIARPAMEKTLISLCGGLIFDPQVDKNHPPVFLIRW